MMTNDRLLPLLACALSLVIACGPAALRAQTEGEPGARARLEGRLLLDPLIPRDRLHVCVLSSPRLSCGPLLLPALARVAVDATGRFEAEFFPDGPVNLILEAPGGCEVLMREVVVRPTGTTRLEACDLRGRLRRFSIRAVDAEGKPLEDFEISLTGSPCSWYSEWRGSAGSFEALTGSSKTRRYGIDARGYKKTHFEHLEGDIEITLEQGPLLRLRLLHPALYPRCVLPEGTHLLVAVAPEDTLIFAPVIWGRIIDGIAMLRLEEEGPHSLRIYIGGLELPSHVVLPGSTLDPWMLRHQMSGRLLLQASPSSIQVRDRFTEVEVIAQFPTPQFMLATLRLRLEPDLARSVQGEKAPLWAAIVPEGETVPEVEYLEDLPRRSGRFVDGMLEFGSLETGRYEVRIYRVSPTWFTRQFPDRRLGRASVLEGAQPRTIDVESRLTEIEIAAPSKR